MSQAQGSGGYGGERDEAYLTHVSPTIDAFAANYSPGKPTLILFPGGLGSKLLRDRNANTSGQRDYYTSWIDFLIAWGEPRKLKLLPDGEDVDDHYVIPDGYVDFVVNAYGHFADWCNANGIQLLVYGFDWRRSSQDAADYFLGTFMPAVDAAIGGAGLSNYSLVGHSLGGMAIKLIINDAANKYVRNMKSAITVASPFYGYGGQIHRYQFGIKQLNWTLANPTGQNQEMGRIIGTMPGGYEFLYLDEQTFLQNKAAFAADVPFALLDYPSQAPNGQRIDPYNPPLPFTDYYPFFTSANIQMLVCALNVVHAVAKPLDPSVAQKFFNIRGVQSRNGQRLNGTVVGQVWNKAPPGFDPDAPTAVDPISDVNGFGDGTQPAWSARLLQMLNVPPRADGLCHVTTIEDDVDHMYMMNYRSVQNVIAQILGITPLAVFADWVRPDMATPDEFNDFLRRIPQPRDVRSAPEDVVRRLIFDFMTDWTLKDMQRLAWRGFTDLLR